MGYHYALLHIRTEATVQLYVGRKATESVYLQI
jgi:hypothetical protein